MTFSHTDGRSNKWISGRGITEQEQQQAISSYPETSIRLTEATLTLRVWGNLAARMCSVTNNDPLLTASNST